MNLAATGSLDSSVRADAAAAAATPAAAMNVAVGAAPRNCVPSVGAIARPIHQENPIDAMYRPRSLAGARSATSGITAVVCRHSPSPTAMDAAISSG